MGVVLLVATILPLITRRPAETPPGRRVLRPAEA
jgi:hypothetical protein